jgi:uncharacterized protein (DUF1684 family)
MDTSARTYGEEIQDLRDQKDEYFATSPDSPIPDEERAAFRGLRYFAPDPAYRVEAELVRFPEPEVVQLGTTKGIIVEFVRYGELRFTLAGQACRLTAYITPAALAESPSGDHDLSVPFRDGTTGHESYGAGRYLHATDGGAAANDVALDFNLAYSPWCAYNDRYTCLVPPAENVLPLSVKAGELTYH